MAVEATELFSSYIQEDEAFLNKLNNKLNNHKAGEVGRER